MPYRNTLLRSIPSSSTPNRTGVNSTKRNLRAWDKTASSPGKFKGSKLARSGEHSSLARCRVSKAQSVRVQEAPVCQSERFLRAVKMIAEDGVADRIHVQTLPKQQSSE